MKIKKMKVRDLVGIIDGDVGVYKIETVRGIDKNRVVYDEHPVLFEGGDLEKLEDPEILEKEVVSIWGNIEGEKLPKRFHYCRVCIYV